MNTPSPLRVEMHGSAKTALKITVHGMEPKGMNGANGLLRAKWKDRAREQRDMALILRSQGRPPEFLGPVTIEYFRSYMAKPMDQDNLTSSFKMIGDALVKLGVIEDDTTAIVTLVVSQAKRAGFGKRFSVTVTPRQA